MAIKPIIAVVDDEEPVRSAFKRLIRSAGYDVDSFSSGSEFLHALSTRPPDCLILDIHMPTMTGLDVQSVLNARKRNFPIIIITALEDRNSELDALAAGAFRFLRKPVADTTLLEALQSALARRGAPP